MRRAIDELEARAAPSHAVADHIHATLTIKIEDEDVFIPANIGLGNGHFNPHTHSAEQGNDSEGVLHIGEGGPAGISGEFRYVKLSDFFDVWREIGSATAGRKEDAFFSRSSVMGYDVDENHAIDFYVNGSQSNTFENYIPHDGDNILIHYRRTSWTWQNTTTPEDVSADGEIVPRDALLVINELIKNGSYEIDTSVRPLFYYDVSGDGFVSPIDALQVINRLL